MDLFKLADVIFTALLGVAGLYLANSFQRQLKIRIAERRMGAYADLFARMRAATPVRLAKWIDKPLTLEERKQLFRSFTDWYFENGNGMLLGDSTRYIYLKVKDNLVCPDEDFLPDLTREELLKKPEEERERERGVLAINQLSLLRTHMKADLDVYGTPYHVEPDEDDEAFFKKYREELKRRPWAQRLGLTRSRGRYD